MAEHARRAARVVAAAVLDDQRQPGANSGAMEPDHEPMTRAILTSANDGG